MTNLLQDFHIAKKLLSCLWLRNPFIISVKDNGHCDRLALQLLEFVPEYRQIIACGGVPKSAEFSTRKPRILNTDSKELLKESLFSSFEEEKLGARPIQLVYFQGDSTIFNSLLLRIQHGWFATTTLPPSDIIPEIKASEVLELGDDTILFLEQTRECLLEDRLLKKARTRPAEIAPFLFQLKMSEIHLIGNAILKEIENGVVLSQVEIQELFEIDEPTFQRIIDLQLCESFTDIKQYILRTPPEIKEKLDSIIEIDSIYMGGVIRDDKLIALSKSRDLKVSSGRLFPALSQLFRETMKQLSFGETCDFTIEFKCGKKILLIAREPLTYCFLTDARLNIDLLLEKISIFL
ncbi:hypothetical protein JXJ21_20075 [candidate division KSB1 bacterium]|nr:hypothetical protein [candidate division KSB1 bacterium]